MYLNIYIHTQFCDGLGYGGNTKAAIIRIGLKVRYINV